VLKRVCYLLVLSYSYLDSRMVRHKYFLHSWSFQSSQNLICVWFPPYVMGFMKVKFCNHIKAFYVQVTC
jgi:hypothetical protein